MSKTTKEDILIVALHLFARDGFDGLRQLIGQNMFMKAVIAADDGRSIPIMTMGPICIAPELRKGRGKGKILLDYF